MTEKQSYAEWEAAAEVEQNLHVSREVDRAVYKIDGVYVSHDTYFPHSCFEQIHSWVMIDLQFIGTERNKSIVASFGGSLDGENYCSEGYYVPMFHDSDNCLEHAWNFIKGYKNTDIISDEESGEYEKNFVSCKSNQGD